MHFVIVNEQQNKWTLIWNNRYLTSIYFDFSVKNNLEVCHWNKHFKTCATADLDQTVIFVKIKFYEYFNRFLLKFHSNAIVKWCISCRELFVLSSLFCTLWLCSVWNRKYHYLVMIIKIINMLVKSFKAFHYRLRPCKCCSF